MGRTKSLRLSIYLAARSRQAPADSPARIRDLTTSPRPDGPLVWVHTGKDADAQPARALAKRLQAERPELSFVFTTSAARSGADGTQLTSLDAPSETARAVSTFLDHWRPDLALWTDLDLRPLLISEAYVREIPLFMVEATEFLPAASGDLPRGVAGDVLQMFDGLYCEKGASDALLRRLGATRDAVENIGRLQEPAPSPDCNLAELDALASELSGRPVWLAAGLVAEELQPVLEAHVEALRRSHRLLLIVSPDTPASGPIWADALAVAGHKVACRSRDQDPLPEHEVYVADLEGELGLWYRLSPISFLGSSLGADGGAGIDPFHAAALGSAIIHGPYVSDHQAAYSKLRSAAAARLVRNGKSLGETVEELLSPTRAALIAKRGWDVASAGAEVTDHIMELVLTRLEDVQ